MYAFYQYLNQDVIMASEIQICADRLYELREHLNDELKHLFEVNMQSEKVRDRFYIYYKILTFN